MLKGIIVAGNPFKLLGQLRGANFNVTTDQPINLNVGSKWALSSGTGVGILVTNASLSLTTAAGGFYTATAKGGTALVAATQAYSALTTATSLLFVTTAAAGFATTFAVNPIYFSLTTAQGAAATADIYVYGFDLT